jgi:RHS repeat-associated protein
LTRFTHISNKVGNRDVMIREDGDCRYITTYSYDENDRLTGSSTSIEAATLEMQRKLDRKYAGRPRGWTRWAVLGFAGATLSAFWMPLFLPSSRRLGRRARRKQLFTACVATFLAPLMAVHPEAAHALTTEAIQAQVAITAGVALDCDDTVTTTYDYDDNGNQIRRTRTDSTGTQTDTYVFDYNNRLVGATSETTGTSTSVTYTYDADGVRNSKHIADGDHIRYLTDKNRPYAQVIEELTTTKTGDATFTRYAYGDDLISLHRGPAGSSPDTKRFYHYDGQMSTRQLTDDNASPTSVAVTHRYMYDAFGVGLEATEESGQSNAYRYTGEQYDGTLGNYYLRARHYNQATGRFRSRDPFGGAHHYPATLHKYAYTVNNPVGQLDPSGLAPIGLVGQLGVVLLVGILSGLLLFGRNTSHHTESQGPFVAVDRGRLKVHYHSIRLVHARESVDAIFDALSRLSNRDLYPVRAFSNPTSVGDDISFDMIPVFNEIGQGDFSVRVTQFNRQDRFFVVRTLAGHPLAGWRYWGVRRLSNEDVLVETFAVVHPATAVDQVKMSIGGAEGMSDTWTNMLFDIFRWSGAEGIRASWDSAPWGVERSDVNNYLQTVDR